MPLEVVTPPAENPVSLAEAKLQCRVDHAADDAWFPTPIAAATKACETMSGRAFVTQTLKLTVDRFPWARVPGSLVPDRDLERYLINRSVTGRAQIMLLPRPRLRSVASVKYIDTDGAQQTLASSEYKVDAASEPGRIVPAWGKAWPATRDEINAVEITYDAGYGAAAAVDEQAKQAILLLVAHWYENRETVLVGTMSKEIEQAATRLMQNIWHGNLLG